jgi:hypothetical protein
MDERDWIEEIQIIRVKNNKLWMELVRIAAETAPERTKKVMKQISANDEAVTKIVKEYANE